MVFFGGIVMRQTKVKGHPGKPGVASFIHCLTPAARLVLSSNKGAEWDGIIKKSLAD